MIRSRLGEEQIAIGSGGLLRHEPQQALFMLCRLNSNCSLDTSGFFHSGRFVILEALHV